LGDLEYNDQIRLCTIFLLSNLSAFNAPRQHVQKDKKKKKEKNTYEKTNNNKHHQLEEQLTMSTSRNLEKFSTPENWRVFVARVRKQTGANAGNGPLLLENVTLIHPIKGRR